MRILHTSDWHLGRSFCGVDLLTHQAAYVDHLLATVAAERVDVVLVSGDVYDRALPPVDAVRLAHEALSRLAAAGVRVVVTSGNHDSARRLGFGADLIDAAGVHLRTELAGVGRPVLLDDDAGPVAVYGLPYLDPDVARDTWGLAGRSHEAALSAAMGRVRADLATPERRGARSVVLAHAFVGGARPCDSERDISVGGVSMVPTSTFAGVHYTALGHLHGRHVLDDRVRYSGSPLAYSFSEAAHTKGGWLVDLAPDGGVVARFVEAPVPRPLVRLSGPIEQVLADPALARHERAWAQVTLTDPVRPRQAMERLRRRFPHTLSLIFAPSGADRAPSPARPVAGRSDHEVALDFVRDLRGESPSAAESALLLAAAEACCGDRDLDPLGAGEPIR